VPTSFATKLDSLIAAELKAHPLKTALPDRCPHGVYIPAQDRESGKAPYCTGCYSAVPFQTRKVVLPRTHTRDLDGDSEFANRKTPGRCPECGSACHEEQTAYWWICADCGTGFKAPRRRPHAD
jgi:hypothetical protein